MARFYARRRRRPRWRAPLIGAGALIALCLLWTLRGPRPPSAEARADASAGTPTESVAAAPPPPLPASYAGKLVVRRLEGFPERLISLTFDDGPDPTITPQVLRTLEQFDAKATFFVQGVCAKTYPDLVRQMVQAGHSVESHTWSHKMNPSEAVAREELDRTSAIIEELSGRKPTILRPPYGFTERAYTKVARRLGYCVVTWTHGSEDTTDGKANSALIAINVVSNPRPGDIVLLHDSAIHQSTASALTSVLRTLGRDGWKFVTLPELLTRWEAWEAERKAEQPQPSATS